MKEEMITRGCGISRVPAVGMAASGGLKRLKSTRKNLNRTQEILTCYFYLLPLFIIHVYWYSLVVTINPCVDDIQG